MPRKFIGITCPVRLQKDVFLQARRLGEEKRHKAGRPNLPLLWLEV